MEIVLLRDIFLCVNIGARGCNMVQLNLTLFSALTKDVMKDFCDDFSELWSGIAPTSQESIFVHLYDVCNLYVVYAVLVCVPGVRCV